MQKQARLKTLILSTILSSLAHADNSETSNPCNGDNFFLALVNRPTVLDSVCTVPAGDAVVEMGDSYQTLTGGGNLNNLPQGVFRYGLADNFEVNIILPNYIQQTVDPKAGFTQTTLTVKHEVAIHENWMASVEGSCVLPSGSYSFGSDGPGTALSGIVEYNVTPSLSATVLLGVSSYSEPTAFGGNSYKSFNTIGVLSWTIDKWSLYGEVSGETHTGVGQGSGYNMDTGVLYLLKQNIIVDVEVGQRISGNYGGFNHYYGAGISLLFE